MTNKLIFSTQSYQYLQERLLDFPNLEAGQLVRKTFPDGEHYYRIEGKLDDRDVLLLGGTVSDQDTMELLDIANGLIAEGIRSLSLVIPYFGYSTMERAVKPGEVVMAKVRAKMLSAIPAAPNGNKVFLFDLHSEGIPYYFGEHIFPIHVYCKSLVKSACESFKGEDFVLASTDMGRAKWVESLANDLGVQAGFIFKKRLSGDQVAVMETNAEVEGKKVIIYDDMIRTGGSLLKAAQAYSNAGALEISFVCTHGLFSNNALQRIQDSGLIQQIFVSNTHPNVLELESDYVKVQSVAPLMYEALKMYA